MRPGVGSKRPLVLSAGSQTTQRSQYESHRVSRAQDQICRRSAGNDRNDRPAEQPRGNAPEPEDLQSLEDEAGSARSSDRRRGRGHPDGALVVAECLGLRVLGHRSVPSPSTSARTRTLAGVPLRPDPSRLGRTSQDPRTAHPADAPRSRGLITPKSHSEFFYLRKS